MDLNRRRFLKLLTATAVSLGLDPLEGIAIEDGQYFNRRIGLACTKPTGWIYDSIADFVALREKQILEDALPGEAHPLNDPSNLPLFIAIDPNNELGRFSPAIALYDELLNSEVPDDQVEAHRQMIEFGFKRSYRDVCLLAGPEKIYLGESMATQSVWRYRHEIENDREWLLWVKSILVFRPPRVHTYYLVDSAEHRRVPDSQFEDFIGSIRYL